MAQPCNVIINEKHLKTNPQILSEVWQRCVYKADNSKLYTTKHVIPFILISVAIYCHITVDQTAVIKRVLPQNVLYLGGHSGAFLQHFIVSKTYFLLLHKKQLHSDLNFGRPAQSIPGFARQNPFRIGLFLKDCQINANFPKTGASFLKSAVSAHYFRT